MSHVNEIKLYLEGKLNDAESNAFEQRIKVDQELQKEVEAYKPIFLGLKQLRQESFEEEVKRWNEKLPSGAKKSNWSIWRNNRILKMVATVALVVGVYLVAQQFIKPDQASSLKQFAEMNWMAPEVASFQGDDGFSKFTSAHKNFIKKDYNSVINDLEEITLQSPFYLESKYLTGHALFKLQKYKDAIPLFVMVNDLAKEKNNYSRKYYSRENAQWTLILCYLQDYLKTSDDRKKSGLIRELNAFINAEPEEVFKEKAKSLLNILK